MSRACLLVPFLLAIVVHFETAHAVETTPTGLFYPTGTSQFTVSASWLAADDDYYDGECHLGTDMSAAIDDPVYAIANGTVTYRSEGLGSGWGDGNVGIVCVHTLVDGSQFLALYGHIHSDLQVGNDVTGGNPIGTVGPWNTGSHLHFGIHPGLTMPLTDWGRTSSPCSAPYNGFTDPMDWIMTRRPDLGLVVSTGLKIVQLPPFFVGQTLTAQFAVQNIGTESTTLDAIAATGRGPAGDGDFQDFEHDVSVGTLDPGEIYPYQGNLFLTKTGFYSFQASAQKDGSWFTVPGSGILDIEVLPHRANQWLTSGNSENCTGPDGIDSWTRVDFDDQSWSMVELPDDNWGCGACDRFYRYFYYYDDADSVKFSFQSDNGLWLYVNGQSVGSWGDGCRGVCCVNAPWGCSGSCPGPPQNITQRLHRGYNLIAVHVTDGGSLEYFNGAFDPPPPIQIIDCQESSGGPVFPVCPAGDMPYKVLLRDSSQLAIAGNTTASLNFTGWNDVPFCGVQSGWPRLYPVAPSNTAGEAFFVLRAGGTYSGNCWLQSDSCITIGVPKRVSSVDADGDLVVTNDDWSFAGGIDLDGNGFVNALDYELFRVHLGHTCNSPLPIRFDRSLSSDPPSGELISGENATVTLHISNPNNVACVIDSVRFDYAGFNIADRDWTEFDFQEGPISLPHGRSLDIESTFPVPIAGFHGCIESWFWTSCSADSFRTQLNLNVSRHTALSGSDCSAEIGDAFGFPINIVTTPILPPGWSHSVSQTQFNASGTLSISITPDPQAAYGDFGSVTAVGYSAAGAEVGSVTCELTINRIPGDFNEDHLVNVLDVVYVVDCAFRGGDCQLLPGCLYALTDVDCSGVTDVFDAVKIINVAFRSEDPAVVFCDPCLNP